jgi:hypothetical protein
MAQVVNHLPSKYKALSTTNKENKNQKTTYADHGVQYLFTINKIVNTLG